MHFWQKFVVSNPYLHNCTEAALQVIDYSQPFAAHNCRLEGSLYQRVHWYMSAPTPCIMMRGGGKMLIPLGLKGGLGMRQAVTALVA